MAIYDGYKANAAAGPRGAARSSSSCSRELLDAAGMAQAEAAGLGGRGRHRLAHRPRGDRGPATDIVTGDRDLIQLVRDPWVRVLFTLRGVREVAEYDEAGVLAKYGVPADRYADFAILRGDPSDGLPGVRGVGEKTARALVNAYPSLDALLEDAAAPTRTGRSCSVRPACG